MKWNSLNKLAKGEMLELIYLDSIADKNNEQNINKI